MGQSKLVSTSYDDLTYKIIGCAMAVHRGLGPGLREDTYQRDLEGHLSEAGLVFDAQKLFEFGLRSLQHRRVFPPKSVQEQRVNRQWLFVPDWMKNNLEE